MMTQNASAQQRRILNLIWASAGEYGFDPLFMAYGTDRKPDYYMNCIVGFVHKWYGDPVIRELFAAWEGDSRQSAMDDLAWLALENAAYEKEVAQRPVLKELREAHAAQFFAQEYLLSRQEWMAKNQLVYSMQSARWKAVLGKHGPVLTAREKELNQALRCSGSLSAQDLSDAILAIMKKFLYFDGRIREASAFRKHLDQKLAPLIAAPKRIVRADTLKITHSQSGTEDADKMPVTFARGAIKLLSRQSAASDRQYIETCFGRSLYAPQELTRIDQDLCTGTHFGCHLWYTNGSPGTSQDGESQRLAAQIAQQEMRNRQFYSDNLALHQNTIRQIAQQVHNCVLVHQQAEEEIARRGRLDGSRVWREAVLEDDRVFLRQNQEPFPDFTVDLLLDGSASRLRCQETIAAQGYILSESLSRCGISVRVSSFCSLRGYTILRILKDYGDKHGAQKIFRYFAAGWNRDGLALRGMAPLLESTPAKKHLVVLLTDANPSDSHKIPPVPSFPVSREYDGQAGVDDAAEEVRALRRKGIRVAAVFMGVNSSVPAAKQIFGKDLVRIQRMDQLASAAGKLIQAEIRELSN